MLVSLVLGVAFIQCATLPSPTNTRLDAGVDAPPSDCDVACGVIAAMKCKFAAECPSFCRLINNPNLISCFKTSKSCLDVDGCNTSSTGTP